ncbi:MAG: hypothetical protein NT027_20685, partial [Proteobacteria bacterium]|nr:hypothetical protein [Pseudomonadota bacterium]
SPTVTIKTKFTISDPTKFSLQVNCEGWGGWDGMGVNVKTVGESGNVPETYAQVECLRFAK